MDTMRRFMHREKYGKLRRVPNAYELYEAEHRVHKPIDIQIGLPKHQALETRHMKPRRTPDAYQIYEREHKVRTFDTVLAVSPKPSETETGTFTRHYNNHAKPRSAYELYEREHRLHTYEQGPSGSTIPRGHEEVSSDHWYQKGSNVQCYHRPNDGNESFSEENIDSKANKFLAMKHKKFELSKWMSTNAYDY